MAMKDGEALVLVVDDEANSREMVSQLLYDQGYKTLEADNGKTALDLVRHTACVGEWS